MDISVPAESADVLTTEDSVEFSMLAETVKILVSAGNSGDINASRNNGHFNFSSGVQ